MNNPPLTQFGLFTFLARRSPKWFLSIYVKASYSAICINYKLNIVARSNLLASIYVRVLVICLLNGLKTNLVKSNLRFVKSNLRGSNSKPTKSSNN